MLKTLFQTKSKGILSVYFCAGDPLPDGTLDTLRTLQANGVDLVEVGIPFSDPLADGPVIQGAATNALRGGMSVRKLFSQLEGMRPEITVPVILMGYLNPILHYGFEAFCQKCKQVGVDGLIIPDLPFEEYEKNYRATAEAAGIDVIFLVTPETPDERIREIDEASHSFIYAVSSAAVTGAQSSFDEKKQAYFSRLESMKLRNPILIGFGISNRATRSAADAHAAGVIVGSKFVSLLEKTKSPQQAITELLDALAK